MAVYGKVIRIFNETTLLVNVGRRDGLTIGDRVVVLEKGEEVKDPDSGESMGELELVKAELRATDVQERMSIVKSLVKRDISNLPLSSRMIEDSIRIRYSEEKMSVASGEISGMPSLSPVKIGDPVRFE
jgi:hypothetical protein